MVYTRVAGVVEAAGELAADCRLRPVEVHAAIATLRVTDNAVRKALRAIASPVVWGSDWRARSGGTSVAAADKRSLKAEAGGLRGDLSWSVTLCAGCREAAGRGRLRRGRGRQRRGWSVVRTGERVRRDRARSHPPRRGRLHGSGGSAHGRAVGSGSSADRPGRGRGPGPWARPGRRRLPDQAVRLP